jgi:UDP-glucose 4-epimerase
MRILVTGGAGCIGSDLAGALLARGDEVVIFDNFSSGKREHVEPLRSRRGCRIVEADLLDPAALGAALDGVEMVYHLAANPDVKFNPGDPTGKDLQQNVIATYNVLEAMRLRGVTNLAFTSTSAVYGIPEKLPIGENDFFPKPISLYGATKLSCEALISAFSHLFGMRCWIFRLANIVSGKVRRNGRTVISDFICKLREDPKRLVILGDGRQTKSYLASEECVEAMLFAVKRAMGPLTVLNVGCDDGVSVTRIAEMVVEAMGLRDVEFAYTGTDGGWPGDVPRFLLDVSAINQLGWKARYNSEQSVARAIRATLKQLS